MVTGTYLVSSLSSRHLLLRRALASPESHYKQRVTATLRPPHPYIRRRTIVNLPTFPLLERQSRFPIKRIREINNLSASFVTESIQDRSVLQYEFHQLLDNLFDKAFELNYEELEKTRHKLEETMKNLVDNDIHLQHDDYVFISTFQNLMSRCGSFGTMDGAELTEKYLTTLLKSNLKKACLTTKNENGNEQLIPVTPSKEMYTSAMDAWAKAQSLQRNDRHGTVDGLMPARRAKQILDFMWEEYHSKPNEGECVKPDIIHYTTLLQALANASSKNAVQMAQNVLKDVERLSGLNDFLQGKKNMVELDPNLVPDRTVYNTVLYCLSRYFQSRDDISGRVQSVQYIMGLMKDMMNKMELLAKKLNDNSWMPNTRTYNMLLMVCRRRVHCGGKEAEKIVEEMLYQCQRYMDDARDGSPLLESQDLSDLYENSVLPNVKSYNNIINAWCHTETEDAPERAEFILKSLLLRRSKHAMEDRDMITSHPLVSTIRPDIVTFNLVLNAWAKSCQLQSGERAERLLNFMTNHASGENKFIPINHMRVSMNDLDIEPDVISYNSTMNAWSKCGHENAVYRAENVLNRLIDEYEKTGKVVPNSISFSTPIQAWSKTCHPDCGERAEALFNKLVELYQETGYESLKPTQSCYASLVAAYCNQAIITSQMQPFEKAIDALDRLQNEGDHKPKTSYYNMLLSVPSKMNGDESIKFNVAIKAKSILFEMQSESNGRFIPGPDISSFNNVIRGFQNYEDERRKREALFSALDTFNMLCEYNSCEPNYQTYIQLLKAIQLCLEDDTRDRAILCEEIFRKCCESGLLTNAVLKIVENTLPRQSIQRIEACKISSGPGPLTVYNLPPEWSDNRRVGQNQRRNR